MEVAVREDFSNPTIKQAMAVAAGMKNHAA
jgi:hypothetical protein